MRKAIAIWCPLISLTELSEVQAAALKDYQGLERGDFTSFLKLLRNPSSQSLQSRCTAFLNTVEAYHVISFSVVNILTLNS